MNAFATADPVPPAPLLPGDMIGAGPASPAMIGEPLQEQGLVQPAEVARALAFQQQAGGRLGGVLVRMGRMRLRA